MSSPGNQSLIALYWLPRLGLSARPLLLLLFLPVVFLGSCGEFSEPEFRDVDNLKINRFGSQEFTLSMDVRYFNPNKTRLKLKKVSGEAWLDDSYLGQFSMDTLVHIQANGEFTLPVTLQVDMSKLLQNSLSAFLNREVTVRVEGKAKVGKGIFYINYPIRYEGRQDLEKLLK
ncbi:MAG: LEA type 2 family protein [Bacteroidota bacterium]